MTAEIAIINQRRISTDSETVGGPIDVALITKGDVVRIDDVAPEHKGSGRRHPPDGNRHAE